MRIHRGYDAPPFLSPTSQKVSLKRWYSRTNEALPVYSANVARNRRGPGVGDGAHNFDAIRPETETLRTRVVAKAPIVARNVAPVLDAVERLTDERDNSRVDRPLFETMKDTARHLHQAITPFQGMLEARRSIIEVYQTHSRALRDLVVARDKVLTAVLEDLAARVMDHLQGVSWRDLETLGAVHQQPPRPAGYDDLEF